MEPLACDIGMRVQGRRRCRRRSSRSGSLSVNVTVVIVNVMIGSAHCLSDLVPCCVRDPVVRVVCDCCARVVCGQHKACGEQGSQETCD